MVEKVRNDNDCLAFCDKGVLLLAKEKGFFELAFAIAAGFAFSGH